MSNQKQVWTHHHQFSIKKFPISKQPHWNQITMTQQQQTIQQTIIITIIILLSTQTWIITRKIMMIPPDLNHLQLGSLGKFKKRDHLLKNALLLLIIYFQVIQKAWKQSFKKSRYFCVVFLVYSCFVFLVYSCFFFFYFPKQIDWSTTYK